MQVMDPRFFFLLNYGLRDRTRSVPYSNEYGPQTQSARATIHCIIYVTRTPDCVDKDPFTLKQFLPLLLLCFFIFTRLMPF